MGRIVNVSREDSMWVAVIPSLKRTRVEIKHLPAVDAAVRQIIAEVTNVHVDDMPGIEIDYRYKLGDPALERELEEMRRIRELIASYLSDLTPRTAEAAGALIEQGLPVRDIAILTGASPGRISQITPQGAGHFGKGQEVPPRGQGVTKAARDAARAKRAVQPAVEPNAKAASTATRTRRARIK